MRDTGISYLKAIAIVGVIVHHLANRRFDSEAREVLLFSASILDWCVYAFLAVAGWLHASTIQSKHPSMVVFFRARLQRLLLPYFVLTVVYAGCWQVIEESDLVSLDGVRPVGVLAKVGHSLWPDSKYVVAEQMYFFVALFLISVAAHLIHQLWGRLGIAAVAIVMCLVGFIFFPDAVHTGFTAGSVLWGAFVYLTAFSMRCFWRRHPWSIGLMIIVGSLLLAGFGMMTPRFIPLLLLVLLVERSLAPVSWLANLGEASGTIFAYHTPFVLQPLLIASSKASSWEWQLLCALTSGAASAGVLAVIYFRLRNTPFRWVLI